MAWARTEEGAAHLMQLGGSAVTTTGLTIRDLESLPTKEGWRYEIIEGELYVTTQPSLQHQRICVQMSTALQNWDTQAGLGVVVYAPGVIFSEEDAVAPDVVWVRKERLQELIGQAGHLYGVPDLVVEVLSPGRANQMRDREAKLDLYARRGVPEYWLIDPEGRQVTVYRRAGSELQSAATVSDGETLTSPQLPGFTCFLSDLFSS